MVLEVPQITLNNGIKCPAFGLGTWQAEPSEVGNAVKYAIDIGYRHFDCAMLYGNEKEIGEAIREKIKEGVVMREELFIVTKLWNTFHERHQVVPTCKKSLENFGLDYVDLYLIHWPVAQKLAGGLDTNIPSKNAGFFDYDYVETWKGMEECVDLKLTKSIGLSNFNSVQIQRVLDNARIAPVINQIEVSPKINQRKLIKFCKDRNIEITAYSPFGSPGRPLAKPGDSVLHLPDPKLEAIGKKHNKSVAQVVLKYVSQLGTIPIPKSVDKQRMAANLNIFDFELTDAEVDLLDQIDCNGRVVVALSMKDSPHYPFRGVEF